MDFVGDFYEFLKCVVELDVDYVVFVGVMFMVESVDIIIDDD